MPDTTPDIQDAFDAWWDDQPYLGDDNYDREFAAWQAGRTEGLAEASKIAHIAITGARADERETCERILRAEAAKWRDDGIKAPDAETGREFMHVAARIDAVADFLHRHDGGTSE